MWLGLTSRDLGGVGGGAKLGSGPPGLSFNPAQELAGLGRVCSWVEKGENSDNLNPADISGFSQVPLVLPVTPQNPRPLEA